MSANVTANSFVDCEVICAQIIQCSEQASYYFTSSLAVLSIMLSIIALIFYCLYKKERGLRMRMWNVRSEDLRLDKMQWNSLDVQKVISETAIGEVAQRLHQRKADVIMKNEMSNVQWRCKKQLQLDVIDEKTQMGNKRTKPYYTTTGHYKGRVVAVQKYRTRRMSLEKRSLMSDLDQVFMINHEHICKFYGSNQAGGYITVLTEYCTRGSLEDLLKDHLNWDDVFKNSLIFDIVKGMLYLHQTSIGSHGNLKPSNCLIDSRFMVKITDFGIIGERFKVKKSRNYDGEKSLARKKLWTAPELLRAVSPPQEGTKKGDVYSFAIIAQEILYQRGVFYRKNDSYSPEEILEKVTTANEEKKAFRPTLQDVDDIVIQDQWRKTLKKCWSEKPKDRFDFHEIFQVAMGLQTENTLIDSLLQRLQIYSDHLEEKVEEKTEQYKAEKEKSDSLLYQMLPKTVANRLKSNEEVRPEYYNQVTICFSDIVGFCEICHKSEPLEVVEMLNELYTKFDQIIDEFDVYKVETIGDAYLVVSGLPIRNENKHAREIARMAIRLRDSVCNDFQIRHMPNETLRLRVGIHTGPVVAGVVGLKMPRYCLFGDTVNTAARMEQSGKELKIHLSPHTKAVLDDFGIFNMKKRRHSVHLKGIGELNTYWLLGEKDVDTFERTTSGSCLEFDEQSDSSISSSESSDNLSDTPMLSESSTGYSSDRLFEIPTDSHPQNETSSKLDKTIIDCTDNLKSNSDKQCILVLPEDNDITYKKVHSKNNFLRLKSTKNGCSTVKSL